MRAYFYWMLLRRYGPIPLLPTEGVDYTKSYDELSYPRNTYDECVEFIAEEMKQAAKELPEKRDNLNLARPTRGAALAVRAKVYLYGASPLANGNTEMADFTDKSGRILIPQEYDESKWAKAAAAARLRNGKLQLQVIILIRRLLNLRIMKSFQISLSLKDGQILIHSTPIVHCLTERSFYIITRK